MKLKPCPFCGSTELLLRRYYDVGIYYVECDYCGARGPDKYIEDKATREWNTRAFQIKEIEGEDERT